jgi:hypothetical protein
MPRMIGIIVASPLAGGVSVLGYQIFLWFRLGYWTTVSLSDFVIWAGWPIPHSDWYTVEKIILWCLGTPLAADIVVLPLAVLIPVLLIGVRIGDSLA